MFKLSGFCCRIKGAPKATKIQGSHKAWFLRSSLESASEPERRILMCMWSLSPYLHMSEDFFPISRQ